jgi:hypothetical protein
LGRQTDFKYPNRSGLKYHAANWIHSIVDGNVLQILLGRAGEIQAGRLSFQKESRQKYEQHEDGGFQMFHSII